MVDIAGVEQAPDLTYGGCRVGRYMAPSRHTQPMINPGVGDDRGRGTKAICGFVAPSIHLEG